MKPPGSEPAAVPTMTWQFGSPAAIPGSSAAAVAAGQGGRNRRRSRPPHGSDPHTGRRREPLRDPRRDHDHDPRQGASGAWPPGARQSGAEQPTAQTSAGRTPARHSGVQAILLAVDIVAFGDLRRTDEILKQMHVGLYDALHAAFASADIEVAGQCWWQDRGDGALYILPPTISPALLIDPFIDELGYELRSYNRHLNETARIKLRMALHLGTVHFDEYGVIGHSLTRLFDLLEAPRFKAAVAALDTDLGFVASDRLHDDVIRHGPGRIDPAAYHQIEVRDGDETQRAWMYFPPGLTPPSIEVPRMRPAEAGVR